MKDISNQEIRKVYEMCGANGNRPLNNVLNTGSLNSSLKCNYSVSNKSICLNNTETKMIKN